MLETSGEVGILRVGPGNMVEEMWTMVDTLFGVLDIVCRKAAAMVTLAAIPPIVYLLGRGSPSHLFHMKDDRQSKGYVWLERYTVARVFHVRRMNAKNRSKLNAPSE